MRHKGSVKLYDLTQLKIKNWETWDLKSVLFAIRNFVPAMIKNKKNQTSSKPLL